MTHTRWAMTVDTRTCVGCGACIIGCKTENDVATGCSRDWVFTETTGTFPHLAMTVRSERCNQCADAPCVRACPTGSSHYGPGGLVLVTRSKCSGCKACIAACPYGARFVDPRTHTVDKCTRCVHRLENGVPTTSCQDICPTGSIVAGDLGDPASDIARLLATRTAYVLQPEQGTEPQLFFLQ
jgi:Fe-S-cluster-containing dehydrogenase component